MAKKITWKLPVTIFNFLVPQLPWWQQLMAVLNKCIAISQVTAGFDTTNMLTALPSSFLEPLLSLSLTEDPEIRLLVLQILLSLIDRHDNAPKFLNVRWVLEKNVTWTRTCHYFVNGAWSCLFFVFAASFQTSLCSSLKLTSVPDRTTYSWKRFFSFFFINFIVYLLVLPLLLLLFLLFLLLQHGQQLYRHIYLGCKEESSSRRHYEALFALLGLLSMELASEEVVVDLIRLALALQVLTPLMRLAANHVIQLSGSRFLLSRIWLCLPTRLCLCSTAVLFTQSPLPTSTLSVSSPLFQPSANTFMRSVLLREKIRACVGRQLSKDLFLINPFSPALQVIEFRQKESPYLLPEGVFIENLKYVKFRSPLSSI